MPMFKRFKSLTVYSNYALLALLFLGFGHFKLNASNLDKSLDGLIISDAYMPEIPAVSRTAAVYLSFKNDSDQAVVLTEASAEFARHSMFHQSVEINGVAKMKHLEQLVIDAHQSLDLKPGGTHIMLMGLSDLPASGQFELTLYSRKLTKKVLVTVRNPQ